MKRFYAFFKYSLLTAATLFAGVACDEAAKEVDPDVPDDKKDEIEYIKPFSFEQSEDGFSIEISYDEEAEKYLYAAAVCAKEDAESILDAEDPLAAIVEALESKDVDLSAIDDKFIFEGDAVVDLANWDVDFESDYVIAAVAFDEKLERKSEVASFEFSTPAEPEPAGFAKVSVSDVTEGGFTVTVELNSYEGNYAIIPITQNEIDEFGSVEDYVDAYLIDDVDYYGTIYDDVDDCYVFSGDVVFDMAEAWNLTSGMEYMAVVFGAEGDGSSASVTTEVIVSDPVTLLEGSGSGGEEGGDASYPSEIELSSVDFGSIELSNASATSFDYSIEPADDSMPYLIFAFSDEEYTVDFPTDEERILAIYSTFDYLAPYYGYTFAQFVEGSSEPGDYAGTYEEMEPDSKYHVIAFGLDLETYQPVSAVEVASISTLAPPVPTESLASISVSDVTFEDAKISIDAGSYTGYYHLYPISVELADEPDVTLGYAGDYATAFSEAVAYLLDAGYEFDPAFQYASSFYFSGSQDIQLSDMVWMVEPETEYYLLAAGVDADGFLTTEVLKSEPFTTLEAPEFNIDIEVSDISETSAVVSFIPNVKSVYYYNDIILQSAYDAGEFDPEVISSDDWFSFYLSYGDLVWDADYVALEPGTEYCVVAFAYDEELGVISETFTESFKTAGEAAAAAPAKVNAKLYDRANVAQKHIGFSSSVISAPSIQAQAKMQKAAEFKSPLTSRLVVNRYNEQAVAKTCVARKLIR